MLEARFVPLPKWNRQPGLEQRNPQFRATYLATLDKLEYEIGKLGGTDIRIEAGYANSQLRNDGWPRMDQQPAHPGIVLYFIDSAASPLSFPCGTYNTVRANLHAIALTLECLRAVDRYGVTNSREQYRGFLALPAPAAAFTVDDAAAQMANLYKGFFGGEMPRLLITGNEETYRSVYRKLAGRLHPDNGGNPAAWYEFQKYAELLALHHRQSTIEHQ